MTKLFTAILFLLLANGIYAQKFEVSFAESLGAKSFSGEVYVFLSKDDAEPIKAAHWIMLKPVAKAKVENLAPGRKFTLSSTNSTAFPVAFEDMERGEYFAQIVFDGNYGGRAVVATAGNFYSSAQKVSFSRDTNKTFALEADKVIAAPVFKETEYTKKIELPSPLLSKFYKKDFKIEAVVRLPQSYKDEPNRKFPLKISIGGFGANVNNNSGNDKPLASTSDGIDFIQLNLDGNCPTGHTGYANSDNNGPWGDALVYELIPHIEKTFRTNGFRFVTGHSSGGWSSLWLQTHYPEAFHGAWSSSPDAIDFRNFEGVNIYTDANVFRDASGNLLPGMKTGRHFINYKRDVCAWERVVRGEQYMSFNAVFSGRKANGEIDYLWDFATGAINPAQREQWRKYDISHYLTTNWDRLKPKLANKILITMGDADNWSLEKAVLLLKKDAEEKKMEIDFKIISGDHFTVHTSDKDKFGAEHTKKIYQDWLTKNGS
jgi:hypothetical protein